MKALSDRRVLVVDDLRANVQLLAKVLESEYQVSVAFDGESALRSIAESPPDLVLLDIMMPGLDGYEVLRRLRSDPTTHELPVMFLSALEDVAHEANGFEPGPTTTSRSRSSLVRRRHGPRAAPAHLMRRTPGVPFRASSRVRGPGPGSGLRSTLCGAAECRA